MPRFSESVSGPARAGRPNVCLGLLGLALIVTSCATGPGDPWGVARVALQAEFAPPLTRLDDLGRLRTAQNYAVQLDAIAVGLAALTLSVRSGGSVVFDPASPPEGFGLCHGGHCHADDGRLVPYEEVAAAAGLDGAFSVALTPAGADPVPLGPTPAAVALGPCPDECALPRGNLSTVRLELATLTLSGLVFDTVVPPRLPAEGVPFAGVLPLSVPTSTSIDAPLDNDAPAGVELGVTLSLTPKLFDGVDWSALDASGAGVDLTAETPTHAAVGDVVAVEGHLSVALRRFDPTIGSP